MIQKINYQDKYLKYKGKYLNLKNKLNKQVGGWSSDLKKVFKENKVDLVEKESTQNQEISDSVSGDPDEYKTYTYSIGNEKVFKIRETNGIIERDLDNEGKFIFAVYILEGSFNYGPEKILKLLIEFLAKTEFTKLKIYIPKNFIIDSIESILTLLGFSKHDTTENLISFVFDKSKLISSVLEKASKLPLVSKFF